MGLPADKNPQIKNVFIFHKKFVSKILFVPKYHFVQSSKIYFFSKIPFFEKKFFLKKIYTRLCPVGQFQKFRIFLISKKSFYSLVSFDVIFNSQFFLLQNRNFFRQDLDFFRLFVSLLVNFDQLVLLFEPEKLRFRNFAL